MTPYFHSFAEFIAMGKHWAYVWASYGLSFACIIGIILYSRVQRQRLYRDIASQQARQTQRNRQTSKSNSKN